MGDSKEVLELDLEKMRDIMYYQVVSEMVEDTEPNGKRVLMRGNDK